MADTWYWVESDARQGPVTFDQIRQLAAEGRVNASTLVWRAGLPDWRPAGQFPEIFEAVSAEAAPAAAPEPAEAPAPSTGEPAPAETPAAQPAAAAVAAPFGWTSSPRPAGGATSDLLTSATEPLLATRPWVRLLAVLGFVGFGFMLVVMLIMLVGLAGVSSLAGRAGGAPFAGGLGILVLEMGVMVVTALIPALLLNRYAARISELARTPSPERLQSSLAAQRNYWKYVGILTIVMIVLVVIAVLVAFGVGFSAVGRQPHF